MNIEEMKAKKIELGLTNEMISKGAGLPLSTVQKVMSRVTKAPRKATLEAIEAVLYAEEKKREAPKSRSLSGTPVKYYHPGQADSGVRETPVGCGLPEENRADTSVCRIADPAYKAASGSGASNRVQEPAVEYNAASSAADSSRDSGWPGVPKKKDGEYTLDDYYALPDECRVELIDGVFYDMAAPAYIHQKILGELYLLFRKCVDAHDESCDIFLSPCDVRLDRDNRTMVQPDLLMICHKYDLDIKAYDGAPDFTLEILSPSTRAKDMVLKLYKYQNAGVREYWIVDPMKEEVLVYDLEHEVFSPEKYDFESTIPIHISGGECSIDFSRVNRALQKTRARYAAAGE